MIRKKKWWIGTGILMMLALGYGMFSQQGVAVETEQIETGTVEKIIKETGTVASKQVVLVISKNTMEVKTLLVSEGDIVKKGDALLSSEETSVSLEIKSQRAELSGLKVQYNQASELAKKNKALYEQGAMSYETYHESAVAASQLSAQIEALNYSIESYANATGAEGVVAPVSGVVTAVSVSEGQTALAGDVLFELADISDTYVSANFISEDADLMQIGNIVEIYNKDSGFDDQQGTVGKIYPKAESMLSELGINQKRVTVEIDFGQAERPRLGSDIDVAVLVEKKDNVLLVPELAVFEQAQEDKVYVVEDGIAKLRTVEIGIEGEDYYEILKGLNQGDEVILSPDQQIKDGTKLKK